MAENRGKLARRVGLLGVGCVLFVYLLVHLHAEEVFSLIQRIGWYFGLVAAIYCVYEMVRAFALGQCAPAKQRPKYWDLLRIRISGDSVQFLTVTGPFLGEPTMALFLRSRGLTTAQAFAAALGEFLIYTLASAAISIAGLAYFLHRFDLSRPVALAARIVLYVMIAFVLVSAYAIVRRIYLIGTILQRIAGLPLMRRLHIDHAAVRRTEELLFAVLRDPKRFLSIVAVELLAQALLILELLVLLWSTGERFSPLNAFVIEAVTKFTSLAFFFIPGQVGVTEGAYAIVFHAMGMAAYTGFALALARRLRSLLIAGAGLAVAPLWDRHE